MHQGCVRSRQRRRGDSNKVVADVAKLSVGREEYYTRELAENHEEYLSDHGESPGRWYGAGATSLGLQGEASRAGFQRMFEGRPLTSASPSGSGRSCVTAARQAGLSGASRSRQATDCCSSMATC
jgi:hypothetical protein